MTDPHLEYVGPVPRALTFDGRAAWWRKIPWPFLVIVVLPTLIAAIYFLLIASPRYISEARFLVRSTSGSAPSAFGIALQGVGITSGQTDAFAVHEYVTSMDGMLDLKRRFDLRAVLSRPGSDAFSRFPRPGESDTDEGLKKALGRFVTIGYDSTTGISTLRVEAFTPQDAQRINIALLDGGEGLVNRLNQRSISDTVEQARLSEAQAKARLLQAQADLAAFRNQEQFIDPVRSATESSQLIGGLMSAVAQLQAERSEIASQAPASPLLPAVDSRIAAFQRQIAAERAKIVGNSSSLAPRIGKYEELNLQLSLASQQVTQSAGVLLAAEQDARRQKLYLERVVQPSLPDEPLEPRRWLAILIVLVTTLLLYGVGWLLWAGVREHRQE
ncbi:N/A [soil metagenome]